MAKIVSSIIGFVVSFLVCFVVTFLMTVNVHAQIRAITIDGVTYYVFEAVEPEEGRVMSNVCAVEESGLDKGALNCNRHGLGFGMSSSEAITDPDHPKFKTKEQWRAIKRRDQSLSLAHYKSTLSSDTPELRARINELKALKTDKIRNLPDRPIISDEEQAERERRAR